MTIPAFVLNTPIAATPAVYRVAPGGSSLTKLADVGAQNVRSGIANAGCLDNSVIKYGNSLFVVQNGDVYESLDDGANWSLSHQPNYLYDQATTGLYCVWTSEGPYLCYGYGGGSTSSCYFAKYDGSSWTQGAFSSMSLNAVFGNSFAFGGYLWFIGNVGNSLARFDPVSMTTTLFSTPWPSGVVSGCLHGFKGRVFAAGLTSATGSGTAKIWELVGSSWTELHDFTSYRNGGAQDNSSSAKFFVDGSGDLFLLFPLYNIDDSDVGSTSADGTILFRIVASSTPLSSIAVTHLNSSTYGASPNGTLPTILRPGGSNATAYHYWQVMVDSDTNPASPDVYLLCRDNSESTGSWLSYKWNGYNTAMSAEGSFPATDTRLPDSPYGGGDRWFTAGQLSIHLSDAVPVIGGQSPKFRAYGDALTIQHGTVTNGPFALGDLVQQSSPSSASGTVTFVDSGSGVIRLGGVSGTFANGATITVTAGSKSATISAVPTGGGADYTVKFYFDPDRGIPKTQAQLTGTATGGSAQRSGNDIINVTADDGVTEYGGAKWAFTGQGVYSGDRVSFLPFITS